MQLINTKKVVVMLFLISSVFSSTILTAGYEKEIDALSLEMGKKIVQAKKGKLAVVDFTDIDGNTTALGRFIAEEFSVALSNVGKGFRVVDRTHLKSILKEHKLAQSGFIDPATARKLGKIAGVEALVTGNLTAFGDSVRLSIKILDTETAEVISASRLNIAKTGAIEELLSREIGVATSVNAKPSQGRTAKKPVASESVTQNQIFVDKEYKFELQQCRRKGKNIDCNLLITSLEKDKKLLIYGNYHQLSTRLFDKNGQVYKAETAMLGSVKGITAVTTLPSKIPIKAVLYFKGLPETVDKITMLDISVNNNGTSDPFKAQFRNILIEK